MKTTMNLPQLTTLAEGREYTLEFYNPSVKATFLGVHRMTNCNAAVFLYEEDFMRKHEIIDVIYMRPEDIQAEGNVIKHTGWEGIIIEPLHARKDAKKYNGVKRIREAVLARFN
jgi:hypothetical protein